MPGLLLACLPDAADPRCSDAVTALCHGGRFSTDRAQGPRFALHRVTGAAHGQRYADNGDGVRCWVYGHIYPPLADPPGDAPADSAHRALNTYLAHGPAGFVHLNGEFCLVVHDAPRNRLVAANDRFGTRPWYTCRTAGGFVLAPEVKGLRPFLPGPPALRREAVTALLAYNKIRLGHGTLVAGVGVMPAASAWSVDLVGGNVTRDTYWELRYCDDAPDSTVPDAVVDELVDCYRTVMDRRASTRAGAVGLSLSGGLDSRTMIAALAPGRRPDITAYTYGRPDSDEVRLAQRVAESAGVRQVIHALDAPDFAVTARAGMNLHDELDLFVQGAQALWLEPAAARETTMMTGIDLDVTLGGIYLDDDVQQAANNDDVIQLLGRKNRVFARPELERILSPSLRRDALDAPFDEARALVAALPQEHPAATYDLFIHLYSMRRIIFLRYALIRHFMETASPMRDYDFMDRIAALPVTHRARHHTFVRFLRKLSPELAAIPYQRTMLPASAPRRFWDRAAAIEAEREKLCFDIWRETGGRVHVPYRRYYTNFDEWLRLDPAWLTLTDDLLCRRDARVYEMGLLEPDPVAALVADHRAGRVNRRQQLIILMSLELYLQTYFG